MSHKRETLALALALYRKGLGSKAAAKAIENQLGIQVAHTTVQRWWREASLPPNPVAKSYDEATRNVAMDLYRQHGNAMAVSREMLLRGVEVSNATVARWAAREGISTGRLKHPRHVRVEAVTLWLQGSSAVRVTEILAERDVVVGSTSVERWCQEDVLIRAAAVALYDSGVNLREIGQYLTGRGIFTGESTILSWKQSMETVHGKRETQDPTVRRSPGFTSLDSCPQHENCSTEVIGARQEERMNWPSGPVMVWELAGRPRRPTLGVEPVAGVCAMCARWVTASAPTKKWLEGKSFTDPSHLRTRSDRVCEPCAWSVTGKGMDQVRMWTIVARADRALPASSPKAAFAASHLHFTSRVDMRVVVDTLADPPDGQWLVSVAESGQKHTLPYARVNQGSGLWRVRMDAVDVSATPDQFRHVFSHVVALRAAGHSPAEIEALEPVYSRLSEMDALTWWRRHTDRLAPWKCSPLLHLACYLPRKEHLSEYVNRYPAR